MPIFVLLGIILGISSAINHNAVLANFIDQGESGEYNFGLVVFKEIFLYLVVVLCVLPCIRSKYFHLLGISALVLIGYKYGYTMSAIVMGNTFSGLICIIFINIPYVIISTILICLFYSCIAGTNYSASCIRSHTVSRITKYLIIYTILYLINVILFQILIPRFIIIIFL